MKKILTTFFVAFGVFSYAQPNLQRATFSSGSVDNNKLTATIGEPFAAYSKGTGGSLSMGAQSGTGTGGSSVAVEPLEGIAVFPNPASVLLNVNIDNIESDSYMLSVCDVKGQIIMTKIVVLGNNSINLSQLSTGNYVVNITTPDRKKSQSFVVIKNK